MERCNISVALDVHGFSDERVWPKLREQAPAARDLT